MSSEYLAPDRYTAAAQEDRCAPRTRIHIPANFRSSGGRSFETVVHDLSLGGFCCSAINRLHASTICWIKLPGLEALRAEVVWWDNSLAGCAFETLLSPIIHDNLLERWQADAIYRPTL